MATALCASLVAGCSYRLGSLAAKNDDATGSIERPVGQGAPTPNAAKPPEFDLAYARAAAADVLARGGKDNSVPWENPQTGAGGNITPLASSYSDRGSLCRDFLASYVHGETQSWLQGAACRTDHGTWEVKILKPLDRS